MAPRTVICAGDSTPFNITIAAHYDDNNNDDDDDDVKKSDPLKFGFDADVERIAGHSKHKHHSSKTVLPKDGIVVKQEIVRSVTYKGDSWNGYWKVMTISLRFARWLILIIDTHPRIWFSLFPK